MSSSAPSDSLPELRTARLTLRPFQLDDPAHEQRRAGDRSLADTTLRVPHPYLDGMAEEWINTHVPAFTAGTGLTLALTDRKSGALVGAVGLDIRPTEIGKLQRPNPIQASRAGSASLATPQSHRNTN